MKKNILVIDDDKTMCEVIVTLLEEEGYKVKSLPNGNHILSTLTNFQPDLLIVDYLMPGKNGAEITRSIRNNSTIKGLPIIMVAANQHYKTESQKAGVNLFLNKPFDIYELLYNVKNLVDNEKSH